MSLLGRFLARIAPINIGDSTLAGIVAAITAPGEIFETLARDSATHTAWGKALDPDAAPAVVLPWLALLPGVGLQPGDTEDQQRYRIRQAAGLYRCTPRAIVEELQLILDPDSTRTVLLGFQTPDEWHYAVGTLADETPDEAAVERAVAAQEPVGMLARVLATDDWTWFVVAPSLIAHRALVGGVDSYIIGAPEYPTWQDVIDNFDTWQDLIDNTPS